MKLVRFLCRNTTKYGVLTDNIIQGLAVTPFQDTWDINHPSFDGTSYSLDDVRLLVPCEPTKYIGVGLNFSGAAQDMNRECPDYPITFMKHTGAVIATNEDIVLPRNEDCFIYEGEMAVIIGRTAKNVRAENAQDYILGYTCSNDITDQGFFGKDDLKLKSPDTFAPVGPCISTETDPNNCSIRSWKNGQLLQEGNTSEMKFNVAYMVEFLSSYMTLYPGDIISMGTPAGCAKIHSGDQLCVEVEGVGKLYNCVTLAK